MDDSFFSSYKHEIQRREAKQESWLLLASYFYQFQNSKGRSLGCEISYSRKFPTVK